MASLRRHLSEIPPIYRLAALAFGLYIATVYVTGVWVMHEAPESQLADLTVETSTLADLQALNLPPGFTFGDLNEPFLDQLTGRFVATALAFGALFGAAFLTLMAWIDAKRRSLTFWESLACGIAFGSLNLIAFSLFISISPEVNYVTLTGEVIPAYRRLVRTDITYNLAILLHATMIGSVVLIWSRPRIPPRILEKFTHRNAVIAFELHLENWKQYYSWVIALFGGSIATIAVLYIMEVRAFELTFLIHILVVIGGAMGIILLFVVHKIVEIEAILAMTDHELRGRW